MKFEKATVGTTGYTTSRQRMGNTTMTTVRIGSHTIKAVDAASRRVQATSVNGLRWFSERDVAKWRAERPVLITNGMGKARLATRAELVALGAKAKADGSKGQPHG